jgi:RND family efflux transporter MFP subunit
MNRKKLTAMGLVVTLSLSAVACGTTQEAEDNSKVAVQVQNPTVGELTLETSYIGTVSPQEQVYVIPKTSGTVTATYFEVGDTVKEGDVLFTIDDEAAQLQLASAQASYNYAQAGVTAQSGGARELQNYQTEQQIQQLKDSLTDTDDQIDEMEDTLGDLRDNASALTSAQTKAQSAVSSLNNQLVSLTATLQTLNTEKEKILNSSSSETSEENAEEAVTPDTSELDAQIAETNKKIDTVKSQISQAQTNLNTIQTQLASVNSSKTQLKSGISQIEDSQDTIRDNLTTAEQAYAITQNSIYAESDAASAAQLEQVAVGIESAQMQLDYCTVKAPISGLVESVSVEKNGMAAAGSVAYIISNKDSMKVTFQVTEQAKNTLSEGDHITVERNDETYDGVITQIGTMAGQQTKLFAIEATVTGAGDSLPNGVSVKVHATTQKENDKLIVPYDALYFSAGDAYVYCVEDNVIVKTPVTVGLMNDTQAVIEEGLTEDSLVVDNWSSKIRSGAEAEIISVNGEGAVTEEAVETEEE